MILNAMPKRRSNHRGIDQHPNFGQQNWTKPGLDKSRLVETCCNVVRMQGTPRTDSRPLEDTSGQDRLCAHVIQIEFGGQKWPA